MYIPSELGFSLDTITTVAFVFAFFYHLYLHLLGVRQARSLTIVSALMASSYYLSNHYFPIKVYDFSCYLYWASMDLITLTALNLIPVLFSGYFPKVIRRIKLLLLANAVLQFICFFLLINRIDITHWFFSLYGLLINFNNLLTMIYLFKRKPLFNFQWQSLTNKKYLTLKFSKMRKFNFT